MPRNSNLGGAIAVGLVGGLLAWLLFAQKLEAKSKMILDASNIPDPNPVSGAPASPANAIGDELAALTAAIVSYANSIPLPKVKEAISKTAVLQ